MSALRKTSPVALIYLLQFSLPVLIYIAAIWFPPRAYTYQGNPTSLECRYCYIVPGIPIPPYFISLVFLFFMLLALGMMLAAVVVKRRRVVFLIQFAWAMLMVLSLWTVFGVIGEHL